MNAPRLPSGRLHEIHFDFELTDGWVKMPLDAVMFNERLTGQARQLWAWLASKTRTKNEMSWSHAEFKLQCGATARRRSLQVLKDEGFISISRDGHVITMHDPNVVLRKMRKEQMQYLCNTCGQLEKKPEPKPEPQPLKLETQFDFPSEIIHAWNECKPDTFSSIRVLSVKQREAVDKHLKNLGLPRSEVHQFICSVCRGLDRSDFWTKTVNKDTRNFKAVFGYGSPNDVKMKNVEDLYNDGDPSTRSQDSSEPREYTDEQKTLLQELEVHNYEIDMNYNNEERRERSIKFRDETLIKLREMGVNPEVK